MPSLPNITGTTVFQAKATVPPEPPGFCLTTKSIRDWLSSMVVSVKAVAGMIFGYTIGTLDEASPEDRDKPRLMIDDNGRYLGMAVWMPEAQGWSIGGQVGQLMTLVRVKSSVAADLAARPLAGWKLADGTAIGVPNLSSNTNFFQGSAPDYSVYTVAFTG